MTAATDKNAPQTTVDATRWAHDLGLATVLGLSNVSHGLPDRALLNAAFLDAAAAAGLDAAILNPGDAAVMQAARLASQARVAGAPLDAHDEAWPAWWAAYEGALAKAASGVEATSAASEPGASLSPAAALEAAVLRGDADAAPALADSVIAAGTPADQVIGTVLTPAIQRLGDAYGRGEVFLPQMMVAAEAMKAAVARIKQQLPDGGAGSSAGRVAFATVKGDIHSIGKDICVSLLESQGFDVDDLGVDVDLDAVVDAAQRADAVCLSALMTTTLPAMQQTVATLRDSHPGLPVLVGGAVVTAEWAEQVGAGYSADAPGCVEAVRAAVSEGAR
jgi:5-methyltetrahydrofolate--homocysteine methyltransferase